MKKLILALSLISTAAFAVDAPNPTLTPGDVRTTKSEDVCSTADKKITTGAIRNVPNSLAKQVYNSYGLTGDHTGYCDVDHGCEVDHLISLELGGSNDAKNLWPQPYVGVWNARMKDALENRLHAMVCKGQISLPDAQHSIATDWKAAWVKYVNKGVSK
jgi:cytochrome c-type biogenesis protein CcmH/NrfF